MIAFFCAYSVCDYGTSTLHVAKIASLQYRSTTHFEKDDRIVELLADPLSYRSHTQHIATWPDRDVLKCHRSTALAINSLVGAVQQWTSGWATPPLIPYSAFGMHTLHYSSN